MKTQLILRRISELFACSALAAPLSAAPGWTMERFTGVTGAQVSNLTSSAAFYAASSVSTVTSSVLPSNAGENYGTRIRGYVTAPVSGLYTFWESGDDAVTLLLSPDENPANKQVIAYHSGYTNAQQWNKYPTQASRLIPLVAGQKYYIEVLHKEGTGGDNLAIAWTVPGSTRAVIPLSAMETYSPIAPATPAGLTHEFYAAIPGGAIANLVDAPAFQALPTSTTVQATGLAASNVAESFGVRLRGTLTPQVSGEYIFWESGDDAVQLFLSPSDNPADKQLIASHAGWTGAQQWDKYTSQKSRTLTLQAGRSYYIEVMHKEAGGGDNLAIAWTPPSGVREILPTNVLKAWTNPSTDADGDLLPDAYELALGLNPADRADASADSDFDAIPNLQEYRNFANPVVLDQVSGNLADEIWFNVPGDKLNRASYKSAATRHPDLRSYVTTTQAFDKGEAFVRRVRGFLIAPVSGAYQFWGTADDDVDFHLSTSTSKFQLQQIIRNNVLGGGTNFDIDPSQKSQLVTLATGQKYYFELWHKEDIAGSNVALAWKAPNGSRELIPGQYLSSFTLDPDDLDDDGLSDTYEHANGLSTSDDGRSEGSTDGAYGDLDGDGLTNADEQKHNTSANLIDSDGDGVSDFDEVNFFGSATLANDIGAFTPVATIAGDAYTTAFGEWTQFGGTVRQNCRRGSVTYQVTVPHSGIYALKFSIGSVMDGAKNEQHDFHLKINGQHLAYKTITITPDGMSTLALLTPWLQVGQTYNLELFVDNSYNFRRVSIESLQILAAGGTDSNENSIPDWTEIRVNDHNGLDIPGTIFSKSSPAVIEGKAKHLGLLITNSPAPIAAPNGRFFTEVPLTAGTATALNFTFENNALAQTANVHWLPTNLKTETSICIRQGDSLLLTAFTDAENASLESYSFNVNGSNISNTSDVPTTQAFLTAGTQVLSVTHTNADATTTTNTVTITVLPRVVIPSAPVCIAGFTRTWTHPILPSGATVTIDDSIQSSAAGAAHTVNLTTQTPMNYPLLIKSSNGLILGSGEVKSATIRSSDMTGPLIISSTSNMQTVEMAVVSYGDLSEVVIRCEIIIGGVVYDDGSSAKTISPTSFNAAGETILTFLKPSGAHSNCHKFVVRHNDIVIANFN